MAGSRIYHAAIIGLGEMGSSAEPLGSEIGHLRGVFGRLSHAAAFSDHPRVRLVAGSSRDSGRRERFRERWGVENVYADWRRMIRNEEIDVISVATNTPSHAEIVLGAARSKAGAIFLEKPIATRLTDADRMVHTCEDGGVRLVINHTRRWDPTYEKVKDLIGRGMIGRPLHVDCNWPSGRLGCLGTHFFDLIGWVLGTEAESVQGALDPRNTPDPGGPEYHDPGGYGIISFKNGVKAFVNASEGLTLPPTVRFTADRGEITVANNGGRCELWTIDEAGFGDGGTAMRQFPVPIRGQYPMLAAVDEIVRVLDGAAPARSTGRDGVAALEMVIGFHVSDREGGRPIKLPLRGRDRELEVKIR